MISLEQLLIFKNIKPAPMPNGVNSNELVAECVNCTHRRSIPYDAHIQCSKPDTNMTGDIHGIRNGWFLYPLNFDPTWKTKKCDNFESIQKKSET